LPRACATDASRPLPDAVARAFADRTPIDWDALLARVRDPGERAAIEALQRLDALRGPQSPHTRPRRGSLAIVLVRLLVTLAAVQTIGALLAAGAAVARGDAVPPLAPQLLVAAAFAAAGLILASASARDGRVLLLLATFTFAASAFARAIVNGLAGPWPDGATVFYRGVYPEAFVPAALWQFAVLFPAVQRFARFDVWARRIAATAWTLSGLLFAANLGIAYGWRGSLGLVGRDDPRNLFWHLFAAMALPAFAAIFLRACRSPSAEREKAVRFGCALAAGAAPLLLTGVARMAVPGIEAWMHGPATLGRLVLDAVILGALAAMPILATLAIVVDRPFELDALLPLPLRQRYGRSRLAVLTLLRTALVLRPHRYERLTAALDRVRLAGGNPQTVTVLRRELQFGVGARSVEILDAAELPADGALSAIVQDASGPIAFARDAEPFVLLPARDREWLEARDAILAVPVRRRDGLVAAVALLGPRRGGGAYDRLECWFIATLLTGAAALWSAGDAPVGREDASFECGRCGLVSDAVPLPCGCAAAAGRAALPKRLAGKFMVVRRLGAGGMGVVYLARDTALHRDVVLKTLPAVRDGAVARLREEARAMAALNHASLATIYGLELWRRTTVLVVEYLAGGTLADRLARGVLAPDEIIALGISLIDALAYMHQRGVLHRDLKPGNIGFTADGTPKLLDFGLSADSGVPAGTAAYLPPEALAGAPPDAAVDLWGLATVLLEAGGGSDPDLSAILARALAPVRAERFQSSTELRDALVGIAHARG
jgi:hypothetical protein